MHLENNEHDGYEKSQERLVDYMKFGNQSWGRGGMKILRPHRKTRVSCGCCYQWQHIGDTIAVNNLEQIETERKIVVKTKIKLYVNINRARVKGK